MNKIIKLLTGLTFVAMVVVNGLANALPINNRTTGQISDAYANLFTPIGFTFSIWGLIYLMLLGYVLFQFINRDKKLDKIINKINPLFIITSIINIFWILSWHYDFIAISVALMLTLLISLIKIADILRTEKLSTQNKLFLAIPFNIYFGWITVATIANITVFLVSVGWNGFGIPDYFWTSIILIIGVSIGIKRMLKDKSIAYGLVIVWAYLGILAKHLSVSGFNGMYPSIIATIIICLIILGLFLSKLLHNK